MTRAASVCAGCAALLSLVAGCTSVVPFTGLSLEKASVYVNGVTPVVQDRRFSCGPACLASVGTHWGVSLEQVKAAAAGLGSDSTARDLQTLAARLGLEAFAYRGSMEDLRDNLANGRPLITMIAMPLPPKGDFITSQVLELWNEVGPRPAHWVVVVGTVGERWVIVDDPASGPLAIDADRFHRWWTREGGLAVLVAGPRRPGVSPGLPPWSDRPTGAGQGDFILQPTQ